MRVTKKHESKFFALVLHMYNSQKFLYHLIDYRITNLPQQEISPRQEALNCQTSPAISPPLIYTLYLFSDPRTSHPANGWSLTAT